MCIRDRGKFLHTLTAGYTTGAMFVLGISAFYLLKGRDIGSVSYTHLKNI